MQTVGHIEHIGVVYKINHQQVIFSRTAAGASPKLLHIDCFRHCGPCHKQHRGMRAIPAFVQKIAGAKNVGRAGFVIFQDLIPDFYPVPPGNRFRLHAAIPQQLCNFGCMVHAGAEDHGLFAVDLP